MQGLFDTFRESVNLGYLNGLEILHLDKINSVEILRIDTPMGDSAPAYCTALGKAILSQMSDEELNNYFSHVQLKPYGPNTILTKKQLRQDLKDTRTRGYALDNEELSPGLSCVGAPIFDHTTRARYAISISGPTSRMTMDRIDEMQEELRRICAKLSSIMGLELN
jgi:DNA-binding IclR family transcriptional regulator